MAEAGTISHNPNLSSQVTGWSKLAENVGMGPDIDTVHRALVASRPHYANLTDPAMTLMGVGVVTVGGTVFIVENFMRPSGAEPPSVAPTVPAAAPPTTAPRPAVTTPKPPATTVVRAPAPSTTATPAPGTTAAPATSLAGAPPAIAADPPSPWLAMALEMTRSWAGTVG